MFGAKIGLIGIVAAGTDVATLLVVGVSIFGDDATSAMVCKLFNALMLLFVNVSVLTGSAWEMVFTDNAGEADDNADTTDADGTTADVDCSPIVGAISDVTRTGCAIFCNEAI